MRMKAGLLKRLLAALMLMLFVLPYAPPAQAQAQAPCQERSWQAEMPKGVAGYGGMRVEATATDGCHTYSFVNYIGRDGGQPAAKEDAWQGSYCEHVAVTDTTRAFKYLWNVDIPREAIKFKCVPI